MNSKNAYSETFIHAHINNIPQIKHVLYDGRPPQRSLTTNDRFDIRGQGFIKRSYLKLQLRLKKQSLNELNKQLIKEYLIKYKIDLVFAEYGNTAAEMLSICKSIKIPLVVHFHGYDAYHHDILSRYNKEYKELFQYANAIIVVSKDMKQQLINIGAPLSKLYLNTYGVNIDKFRNANPKVSPPLVLSVGRFVDKKAPYLTILAFEQVVQEVPAAKLIMVGEGQLLEACKQLAKSLGIAKSVEFMQVLQHDDIAKLMQGVRVFAQHSLTTSYGDSEGTPNSVLEAGCTGLPVVSTFHAGIKDVIIHGETGFLVNEGDYMMMGKYIIKLLNQPELAGTMGASLRQHIIRNYDLKDSILKLQQILLDAYKENVHKNH